MYICVPDGQPRTLLFVVVSGLAAWLLMNYPITFLFGMSLSSCPPCERGQRQAASRSRHRRASTLCCGRRWNDAARVVELVRDYNEVLQSSCLGRPGGLMPQRWTQPLTAGIRSRTSYTPSMHHPEPWTHQVDEASQSLRALQRMEAGQLEHRGLEFRVLLRPSTPVNPEF